MKYCVLLGLVLMTGFLSACSSSSTDSLGEGEAPAFPDHAFTQFLPISEKAAKLVRKDFEVLVDSTGPTLIFGTIDLREVAGGEEIEVTGPPWESVILIHSQDGWRMGRQGLEGYSWLHVCYTKDHRHLWAVTEHTWYESGWDLYLFHSDDGGLTWTYWSKAPKCCYDSTTFVDFEMDDHGVGRIGIDLQGDYTPETPAGRYTNTTRDWGRHWSRPVRTDSTVRAEKALPRF